MDSVFGFLGEDFAVVVSDAVVGRSILVYKQDQDKICQLDDHKIMGMAGKGIFAWLPYVNAISCGAQLNYRGPI